MPAAVKIQSVPIITLFVSDIDAMYPDVCTVEECRCPRRGIVHADSFHMNIRTPQETNHHWTVDITLVRKQLRVAVQLARSHDPDVLCILRINPAPIKLWFISIAIIMRICPVFPDIAMRQQYR